MSHRARRKPPKAFPPVSLPFESDPGHLGFGALVPGGAYARHDLATFCFGEYVGHGSNGKTSFRPVTHVGDTMHSLAATVSVIDK